jgi:hypothetical protein
MVMLSRPAAASRVGEAASVPSAGAIANAIFDATGVRFRQVSFMSDRVRAGLQIYQDECCRDGQNIAMKLERRAR